MRKTMKRWLSILLTAVVLVNSSASGFSGVVNAAAIEYETAESENGQSNVEKAVKESSTGTVQSQPRLIQDADSSSGVYYNTGSSMTDFRDETIYFVMVTRFYDGDSSNNVQCWDGKDKNGEGDPPWRGDFKGLIEKLDYIKALGFTAVWITPIVKNASGYDYHGYHAINFKEVDPRYESDGCTYQDLIDAVHERDMKIIQDVVFQHTGNWGEENLYPMFTKSETNLDTTDCMQRNTSMAWDPNYDNLTGDLQLRDRLKLMNADSDAGTKYDTEDIYHHEGFVRTDFEQPIVQYGHIHYADCMDLNTENPKVYHYLVDAYSDYIRMGVDAFRVDTVKHISRLTLNNVFNQQLNDAYNETHGTTGEGNFFMFGEVCTRWRGAWNNDKPSISAPFYTWKETKDYAWDDSETAAANATNNASAKKHYKDNESNVGAQPTNDNEKLKGNEYHTPDHSQHSGMNVIDFPMHWAFKTAAEAYQQALAEDPYYNDATFNVTYVDSHDYAPDNAPEGVRYNGSTEQWAENLSLIFTFRGIPCIYYGSEIEFQKGKIIDQGSNIPLAESGRAYFGDYIEGSVNATDFARYNGATGAMADTLNNPLSLHIQRLNRLRACIPALRKGQYSTEGCNGSFAYKRRYTDATTDSFALIALTSDATFTGIPNGRYVDAITGDEKTVGDGTLSTSGIKGQGDLRVYVLDTGEKTPYLGVIDGKSSFMSGGTDSVAATSPVDRGHGGQETVPATGITLDPTSAMLDLGDTIKLTATIEPSNASNKRVSWSTSDSNVAKVSGGTVTAVNEGTATITAKTSNGLTATADITVKASGIKVESVTLTPLAKTLNGGETLQLTASLSPSNADPKYTALTWKSSDAKVAAVDQNGLVTAGKAGTATITVSTAYFGKSATAVITVKGPTFTYLDGDAVYFEKPSGWGNTVYAYFWTDSGAWKNAEWPGAVMTALNENAGIYGIKWPEGKPETGMSVIFTDGGGDSTKTSDLSAKINGYYDQSGFVRIVDPNVSSSAPIDINSFTADPASGSAYKGNSVKLTAVAAGGTGTLQYRFTAQPENGSESTIQDYDTAGTATWTPQTAGRYTLKVYVKDSGDGSGVASISDYEVKDNTSEDIQVSFTNPAAEYIYDGNPKEPEVSVKDSTKTLTKGTDYTVRYLNNVNAGGKNSQTDAPTVLVTGTGSYAGKITESLTFTIEPKTLAAENVSVTGTYTYTGNAVIPAVTVADGQKVLSKDSDYEITYSDNMNAGTAHVTVTGTANYTGRVQKEFTIGKAGIPAGAPENEMTVAAGPLTGINLNNGWELSASDRDREIGNGETIEVTVVYNGADKDNYQTTTVRVRLTGVDCKHEDTSRYKTEGAVAPTCTEEGYSGRVVCMVCQTIVKNGSVLPATGHSWEAVPRTDKAATCNTAGSESVHCSRCDATKDGTVRVLPALGHTGGKAACSTQAVCDRCRTPYGNFDSNVHSWDAGKVTKAPTASEEGIRTYTCTGCGETKTGRIPKQGGNTGGSSTEQGESPVSTDVKAGDSVTDKASNASYKIINGDAGTKAAEYVRPSGTLKTVKIPDQIVVKGKTYPVTGIADNAFKNNKKVQTVKMGSNVRSIGKNAFYGCSSLKKITLSKNVYTIGSKAFYKCTKLTSITVPSKVSGIGSKAFYGCKKLKKITIKTTKLTSKKVGSQAFKGIASKATIKVPKKKLKVYKKMLKAKGAGSKVKIKK